MTTEAERLGEEINSLALIATDRRLDWDCDPTDETLKAWEDSMRAVRTAVDRLVALAQGARGEPVAYFINTQEGLPRTPVWHEIKDGECPSFTHFALRANDPKESQT